eukprot:TRINITY_DN177_c0_g2_i1.p1 TRINITY_DN177_c0_g2~~TRINITY_DN177_c0_g2_i1.p1  ORF type:complete len:845 (+),score=204.33 TRINITY_DN177_c0_g2_i1:33-2537(+)
MENGNTNGAGGAVPVKVVKRVEIQPRLSRDGTGSEREVRDVSRHPRTPIQTEAASRVSSPVRFARGETPTKGKTPPRIFSRQATFNKSFTNLTMPKPEHRTASTPAIMQPSTHISRVPSRRSSLSRTSRAPSRRSSMHLGRTVSRRGSFEKHLNSESPFQKWNRRFRIVVIAGVGFFCDTYDMFVINIVLFLLSSSASSTHHPLSAYDKSFVSTAAIIGALFGQLIFGFLGDSVSIGRKRSYIITLSLVLLGTFLSAFVFDTYIFSLSTMLAFYRFLLGIGIGGEYPLSATIVAETTKASERGRMTAAVFSVGQGLGAVSSSLVALALLGIFGTSSPSIIDLVWRLCLLAGAVPGLLTFYLRAQMKETESYVAFKNRVEKEGRVIYDDENTDLEWSPDERRPPKPNMLAQINSVSIIPTLSSKTLPEPTVTVENSEGEDGDEVAATEVEYIEDDSSSNEYSSDTSDLSGYDYNVTTFGSKRWEARMKEQPDIREERSALENAFWDRYDEIMYSWRKIKKFKKPLIGTAGSWFLMDITFYANGLFSAYVLRRSGIAQGDFFDDVSSGSASVLPDTDEPGILDENTEKGYSIMGIVLYNLLITSVALPGYWVALYLIENKYFGRKKLQIYGFIMTAIIYFLIALLYAHVIKTNDSWILFLILYALSFFFINAGPNTTTYVLAAESFPTEIRSTCSGISAAAGKLGAIFGAAAMAPLLDYVNDERVIFVWCGIISGLGALITWLFVKETRGRELSEIVKEEEEEVEEQRRREREEELRRHDWVTDLSVEKRRKGVEEEEDEEEEITMEVKEEEEEEESMEKEYSEEDVEKLERVEKV